MATYGVAVVGLGAMGGAPLLRPARRGARVGPVERDELGREVAPAERAGSGPLPGVRLGGLGPAPARSARWRQTATPDHGLLVTPLAHMETVRAVSAGSGLGFTHEAAVGEARAAEWAGVANRPRLAAFSARRFDTREQGMAHA